MSMRSRPALKAQAYNADIVDLLEIAFPVIKGFINYIGLFVYMHGVVF